MPYATIEDVENRLGITLTTEEALQLDFFLQDFSDFLDEEIVDRGKILADVPLTRLKRVTAYRGINKYLQTDLTPGVASMSQTMGGESTSVSYSGQAWPSELFELTPTELRVLGLAKRASEIINIPIECDF